MTRKKEMVNSRTRINYFRRMSVAAVSNCMLHVAKTFETTDFFFVSYI